MHRPTDVADPTARPLEYAAPGARRRPRLDGAALTTHLTAWLVCIAFFHFASIFIVPRCEDVYRDYRVNISASTKQVLQISRADHGQFLALLIGVALAHSFAAALWYPRAGRGPVLAYRLLVILLLPVVLCWLVMALCLPLFTIRASAAPPAARPATAPVSSATLGR